MTLYDQIIEMIKKSRGRLWTSQGDLAKRAGVSQSQISKLLKKESTIRFTAACALLESLGARLVLGSEADLSDGKGGVLARVVEANEKLVAENVQLLRENADLRVALVEIKAQVLDKDVRNGEGKSKKAV